MDTQTFLNNFGAVAQAPGGVEQLRKLVLALAVSGKLVEQLPADGSAQGLLAGLPGNRQLMIDEGVLNKPRHPVGEPVDVAPHLIPESWSWVRLGDIGAIVGGGTPKSNEPRYWSDGEGVAWLTPADMRDQPDRLVTRGSRDITSDGLAESSAQLLPSGAVLFSSRAPIGHVAIAAAPLATNQGFKSCVPYESSMAGFVFTFLRHIGPEVNAQATGTTFKEVSGKEVALIPVPVPPLAEQHRIVAKVDELMALCDELETQQQTRQKTTTRFRSSALDSLVNAESNDELRTAWQRVQENWAALADDEAGVEGIRALVLDLAVHGRLVEQNPADECASDLLASTELEWSRLESAGDARRPGLDAVQEAGELPWQLPPSWEWSHFGLVAPSRLGKMLDKAKNKGPLRPYIRNANVQWFRFELDDVAEMRLEDEEYEEHAVRTGDLVVCEGGHPGRTAIADESVDGMVFQKALHRARPMSGMSAQFLAYLLRRDYLYGRLAPLYTGATIKHLTGKSLKSYVVPVPPAAEQERIVARIEGLMGLCDRLEASLGDREAVSEKLSRSVTSSLVG